MKKSILIIIPCYNEEASITGVLASLSEVKDFNLSVVVINDCSKDNTAAIVRRHKHIKLLDLPINLGIGGAMQTGYKYAHANGFDMAIQLDGDGQHLPSELHKLINHHLATNDNVVVGSRFLEKTAYKSSFSRRTGIYYFQLVNKLLIGKAICDSTSGFRLFDRKAIEVVVKTYPDEYPEPESLVLFSRMGLKIAEVAVEMQERQGGTSSIGSFSAVYYMVKVTMAMMFSYIRYSKK